MKVDISTEQSRTSWTKIVEEIASGYWAEREGMDEEAAVALLVVDLANAKQEIARLYEDLAGYRKPAPAAAPHPEQRPQPGERA